MRKSVIVGLFCLIMFVVAFVGTMIVSINADPGSGGGRGPGWDEGDASGIIFVGDGEGGGDPSFAKRPG